MTQSLEMYQEINGKTNTAKYYLVTKRNEVLIHDTNMDESHKIYANLKKPNTRDYIFSSVQFSRSVMSDSLQPQGLQHTMLPCPSPSTGVCSNSQPLSQWCHPTISSSVIPFSSRLQSFPASGSFPMSQFFTLGGQTIRRKNIMYLLGEIFW